MSSSSLWRTERPRFPQYTSDGRGRDYYIKYDNGGYWADQFKLKKIEDYERYKYSNFHTLFHQAAPFKYWGNGHGRETYILQTNGLFHDQKPLCAYKLTDFLRDTKSNLSFNNHNHKRQLYLSVSEKKYNDELRHIEKQLIKRLYTSPMAINKKAIKSLKDLKNNRNCGITLDDQMRRTFTSFNVKNSLDNTNSNREEEKGTIDDNKLKTDYNWYDSKKNENNFVKINNREMKIFNKTCENFNTRRKYNSKKSLKIKTDDDCHFNITKNNLKYFFNTDKINKICSTINYIKPENDLRYIDPRSKYNRVMKVTFNFKPKPKSDIIKIKKIKTSEI